MIRKNVRVLLVFLLVLVLATAMAVLVRADYSVFLNDLVGQTVVVDSEVYGLVIRGRLKRFGDVYSIQRKVSRVMFLESDVESIRAVISTEDNISATIHLRSLTTMD